MGVTVAIVYQCQLLLNVLRDTRSDVTPAMKCITNHPGFCNVCLDIWVLQTAYYVYRQHYGSHARQGALLM